MTARTKWTRIMFAGPVAVVVALVTMAGMARWLPGGMAGIDNLVLPLVFVPLIWAGLFFHACLDRRLVRVIAVSTGLLVVHGGLIAQGFLEHQVAPAVPR